MSSSNGPNGEKIGTLLSYGILLASTVVSVFGGYNFCGTISYLKLRQLPLVPWSGLVLLPLGCFLLLVIAALMPPIGSAPQPLLALSALVEFSLCCAAIPLYSFGDGWCKSWALMGASTGVVQLALGFFAGEDEQLLGSTDTVVASIIVAAVCGFAAKSLPVVALIILVIYKSMVMLSQWYYQTGGELAPAPAPPPPVEVVDKVLQRQQERARRQLAAQQAGSTVSSPYSQESRTTFGAAGGYY